ARISGQPACDYDFKSGLQSERDACRSAPPDHAGDTGSGVFEIAIDVSVAGIADFAQLSAHAPIAISAFHGAIELGREFGNREFRKVKPSLVHRVRSHCQVDEQVNSMAISAIHSVLGSSPLKIATCPDR